MSSEKPVVDQTSTVSAPDDNVNTPYDDAFRTMVVDCRQLLIPLVNEVFGKKYTGNEEILPHPNEHFLNQQDGEEDKRVTDSSFTIIGDTRDKYIIECQSTPDSSMTVRIFEYITQEALDSGEVIGDTLYVTIPHAALLFLRSSRKTPDTMFISMDSPGGKVSFDVPVIKVSKYTLEDIFEKKLLFLLPFHIFVFEKDFSEYNNNKEALARLQAEYREFIARLDEVMAGGELSAYHRRTIIDMSKRVLAGIARNYDNVREGVGQIMGGKVLEHEGKTIYSAGWRDGWRDGEARGEARGEIKGEIKLATLIDKLFSLERVKDAQKAAKDEKYRAHLFKEFNIH